MRETGKLSAAKVAKVATPGRYGDGAGLWLQVSKQGTRAWIFRYKFAGRPRHMGLGSLDDVSLSDARVAARIARTVLRSGDDPIELRRQKRDSARAEASKRITFRDAAEKYIAAHKAGWKNAKHADQWGSSLAAYAYPVIGSLSVAAVEAAHVHRVLEPIWTDKTETASRLRGRIEAVLDWATAHRYRQGENPARWKGHLEHQLPAKAKVHKIRHQPAMVFVDVPGFVATLRSKEGVSAKALEFTILSAARTGEVIGARWDEFDLAEKVWTVPAARIKAGREHRVPLSERAVAILEALPREKNSPFVFPGARRRQPLSNMAMLELLRGIDDCEGLTVHGFRSTFRDWAGEQTNYPREVAEAALGHVVGDKTEAAYRRGDALEKRRRLMEAWSRYCGQPRPVKAGVIALRPGRS